MNRDRFEAITRRYAKLRVAVIGDFCLDRYLEIDPSKTETSIETGLPVFNVIKVRAQPGGAGTVLNNLVALSVGEIFAIGVAGEDGEGYELRRALSSSPRVRLDYFLQTAARHTFTYCKPLIIEAGKPPRELNRLDQKNWTPMPSAIAEQLSANVAAVAKMADALVLIGQEDQPTTGVLSPTVLARLKSIAGQNPKQLVLADSRCGLGDYPPAIFKMNARELATLTGTPESADNAEIANAASTLARNNQQPVFITLSERGILAASPDGRTEHLPALPLRGPIDVVGAGDAVSASLITALSAGATLSEALELANVASSIVIHQLGTTGTASVEQIGNLLSPDRVDSGRTNF
jgi:rfaE bifunctional protein kinase chain/domain